MRFVSLTAAGKKYTDPDAIQQLLVNAGYAWLLLCEFEEAQLELVEGVLLWHAGVFYWGHWRWGVFLGGEWRSGHWHGGVWKGGAFKGGTWHNGVWKGGTWHNGKWTRGSGRGGNEA